MPSHCCKHHNGSKIIHNSHLKNGKQVFNPNLVPNPLSSLCFALKPLPHDSGWVCSAGCTGGEHWCVSCRRPSHPLGMFQPRSMQAGKASSCLLAGNSRSEGPWMLLEVGLTLQAFFSWTPKIQLHSHSGYSSLEFVLQKMTLMLLLIATVRGQWLNERNLLATLWNFF